MNADSGELEGPVRLKAAILVLAGVTACSGISGFFVAYVVASTQSRVPRPIREHFDAATVVNALLFAALFAICLRAHLRVRRRGAQQGEVLLLVVRAVPYLMVAAAIAGVVFGTRAGREAVLREDARARTICETVLGSESADLETCLVVGIRCGRSRVPRVDPYESAEVVCVREELGRPADR